MEAMHALIHLGRDMLLAQALSVFELESNVHAKLPSSTAQLRESQIVSARAYSELLAVHAVQ